MFSGQKVYLGIFYNLYAEKKKVDMWFSLETKYLTFDLSNHKNSFKIKHKIIKVVMLISLFLEN
jgi:hypothetical protein